MSTPFPSKSRTAAPATTKGKASEKPVEGDGFDSAAADGDVTPGKAGDPFSTPPGVSEVTIKELVGHLMLVKPTEVLDEMQTEIGQAKDVVRADFTILDNEGDDGVEREGDVYEDVLVFQTALKRALLKVLDGANPYLLGRLEMGAKKPGKNAPYIFTQPDADDMARARAYLAAQ